MYKAAVVIIIALVIVIGVGFALTWGQGDSPEAPGSDTSASEETVSEPVDEEVEVMATATPTITPEPTAMEPDSEVGGEVVQKGNVCKVTTECLADEYCAKASCVDEIGFCVKRPTSCPQVLSPVCSCEGRTYSSACSAIKSGFNVARPGNC